MIFLITSGQQASTILPRVSNLYQVHSVFIFCIDVKRWIRLKDEYPKIIDVHYDLDQLCESVRSQIKLYYRQLQSFSFCNHKQKIVRDLSKESAEFLWHQLFHHLILDVPSDEKAKRQMVAACRKYYAGNPKILQEIDKFERDYS